MKTKIEDKLTQEVMDFINMNYVTFKFHEDHLKENKEAWKNMLLKSLENRKVIKTESLNGRFYKIVAFANDWNDKEINTYNLGLKHASEIVESLLKDESTELKPCVFCGETKQLQVILVDRKNPERDLIKCRICRGEAPRKYWNSRRGNL